MASFDIVNEIDIQKLDNAVNITNKEISTRFDFNGSKTSLELDKKSLLLTLITEDEMRLNTVRDLLIGRMMKQGLEASALDFGKEQQASGMMIRKEIKVKNGIDKETAKKVVKVIKDSGLKVQASIMDDQVRVTGKKLDDLQAVMKAVKGANLDIPLQFTNYRN